MTRYTHTSAPRGFSVGNHTGNLTIQSMAPDPSGMVGDAMQARVKLAVRYLLNADRLLRKLGEGANLDETSGWAQRIKDYAKLYLLVEPADLRDGDLRTLQATVTLVLNGLGADQTIKVGTGIDKGGDTDTMGLVTRRGPGDVVKPYHTNVENPVTGNGSAHGLIHLEKRTVLSFKDGTRTLIHEACHRYAGSHDYWYCDSDGTRRPARGASPGYEAIEALQNADSLAWFIVKVGQLG